MYQGWRIKIDSKTFPNSYIAKGTYSCVNQKRVIQTFKDAYGVEEEIIAEKKKAVISFQIREHNSQEHSNIVSFLQKDDQIMITYFDDRKDDYLTGIFRCENITFTHKTLSGNGIEYNATNITFIEN